MLDSPGAYRHSGRLGGSPLVVPSVGLMAGFVLAIAYAYADVYIPIAGYVSFILTGAFAAGVGYAISLALVKSNCRSMTFAWISGLSLGVVALYFAWAAFVFVLIQRDARAGAGVSLGEVLLRPAEVWNVLLLVNENGWYSIGSSTPTGAMLWVLWGIEAVVIVGGVAMMSGGAVADLVFCERCSHWCGSKKDFMRLQIPIDDDVIRRITEGSADALAEIPLVSGTVSPYLRIDLDRCESCPETAAWRATIVSHTRDKEGKLEEKTLEFVPAQSLSLEGLGRLESLAAREPIELDDEPESTPDDPGIDADGIESDDGAAQV